MVSFHSIFFIFAVQAFAGVAGHPMLRRVLELIIQRAKDGIDVSNGHFVHFHTGPAAWTDAIRSYLGYDYKERWPGADVVIKEVWSNPIMYRLARSVGICLMDWWFYDGDTSETRVRHLFASQKFDKSEYTSWLTEAGAAHG